MNITRNDYFKLVGILALAAHHRDVLEGLARAAGEITREKTDGHTVDCIWGQDNSADELLDLLGILVIDDADTLISRQSYLRTADQRPPAGVVVAAVGINEDGSKRQFNAKYAPDQGRWYDANAPLSGRFFLDPDVPLWAPLPALPEQEEEKAD